MTQILDKIRHLRSLSTSNNVHEAAAAAAAANVLIAKHRISEEEINAADASKKEDPSESPVFLYETGRVTMWKQNLAMMLARHYGCALWDNATTGDNGRKVTRLQIVGIKSDTDIVHYMFSWLTNEIERLSKIYGRGKGHVFAQSYCDGAVAGIREQLTASAQAIKAQAAQDGQSAAIVRLDNRVQESLTTLYKLHTNLRTTRVVSYRRKDVSAFDQGVRSGRNIQLSKGLGGGAPSVTGLLK